MSLFGGAGFLRDALSGATSHKLLASVPSKGSPMRALIALVVLASSVAGCAVYTPSGSVVIDPAGRHDTGGGKFCPPGQAKKGNC